MIGQFIAKQVAGAVVKKVMQKRAMKKLKDYVEKPNDNNKSIDRLFTINQSLESRVSYVERTLDSKRKFVICEKCKCHVEEKEGKWYDK